VPEGGSIITVLGALPAAAIESDRAVRHNMPTAGNSAAVLPDALCLYLSLL
jgi:hypothetical protein